MTEKDFFKEFIETLPQLDDLTAKDLDAEAVDRALAAWIISNYNSGFNFNFKRRDLAVAMIKKQVKLLHFIRGSDFQPYIDALIYMKYGQVYRKIVVERRKRNREVDHAVLIRCLMEFAREVFALGYTLKSLEKRENKNR